MTFQQTIIVGNVGRDPEFKYTPQGVAVCSFTVAVNKVTGKGETRKEKTTWFRVTVWRERAETASQYIKKGMRLMVIGEVEARAYLDKSGQPQATLELTANDFKFLEGRGESSGDMDSGGGGGRGKPRGADEEYPDEPGDLPF